MAFIDRIYRGNGHSERAVNLAGSVGTNGKNLFYDVMLIQTLFHYIAETSNIYNIITGEQILGLGEDSQGFTYRLPKITGVMDTDTVSTISQFQISNASSLLTGNRFDGLIEPAKYRGRTLRRSSIGSRLMAITYFMSLLGNAKTHGGTVVILMSFARRTSISPMRSRSTIGDKCTDSTRLHRQNHLESKQEKDRGQACDSAILVPYIRSRSWMA